MIMENKPNEVDELILEFDAARIVFAEEEEEEEGTIVSLKDITERNKAEEELRKYQFMVESAHDAIFFKDLKSRYIIANNRTLEAFGLSKEKVIGKNDYELMPDKKEAKKNIEDDQIVFDTGKPEEITKYMSGADGKEYWFQAIKVPQFDNNGNIIGLVGIARDITERKHIEEDLKKGQEKLLLQYKHEQLISTIASRLHTTKSFKRAMNEILDTLRLSMNIDSVSFYIFDAKKNEVILMGEETSQNISPLKKVFKKMKISEFTDELKTFLSSGQVFKSSNLAELDKKTQDFFKNRNIHSAFIMPISIGKKVIGWMFICHGHKYDWTNEIQGLLQTIADIIANSWEKDYHYRRSLLIEEKRTEAIQIAERVSHLASIGALAGGIAHEINQPLNALKITVDGMLYWEKRGHELEKDELLENLHFISKQVERIDEIIKQMRVLARQDKSQKPELLNINDVIRNAISLIKQRMTAHNIGVSLELDKNLPSIKGSATQLEQVVINLAINAVNALDMRSGEDKKINITTRFDKRKCILKITDNGPGIPPEYLNKIFFPFFTTKSKGEGMGFGLFIVKNIIRDMSGSIHARNIKSGGARFTIKLPYTS